MTKKQIEEIEKCQTIEELKETISKNKIELSEEELELINGGASVGYSFDIKEIINKFLSFRKAVLLRSNKMVINHHLEKASLEPYDNCVFPDDMLKEE